MTTSRAKSFTYQTSVKWERGVEAVLSAPGKPDIKVSSPPEFRGPEGNWSPENLFVASIETCLMLTFISLARSRKLEFTAYESRAEGLLEPVYGKHVVSKVTVRPRITVKSEAEREKAKGIVDVMEENCFISNSVESDVTLEAEIVLATSPIPLS